MSSLYRNLNHLIWTSITQVMIETTGITQVQETVMRQILGTKLFPYFGEFSGSNGSKFEYTYFREICFSRCLVYPEF